MILFKLMNLNSWHPVYLIQYLEIKIELIIHNTFFIEIETHCFLTMYPTLKKMNIILNNTWFFVYELTTKCKKYILMSFKNNYAVPFI